ncbi:MAG: radical SAM protein [Chloroflexi bacterium]|nr:radical SAM protein [Chloroflexota bacterium]
MSAGPVVLLNPPDPPGRRAVREGAGGMGALAPAGGFAYPPHLLATAAAVLRAAGEPFVLLDAVAEGWDASEALARVPERAVVVAQVSHATRSADIAFLRRLRQERPGVRSLLVGPAAAAEVWLAEDVADAALVGEPEMALPAAIRAVANGGRGQLSPSGLGVPGYGRDDRLIDLDGLPFPAWDVVPWQRYRFLTVFSSRGCPDGCSYCPYVLGMGDRLRKRSVERVLEELRWLAERFDPPRVVFRDPVFARDRRRVLALCEGIRRMGISLAWECESRPEHFDPPLLAEMRAAGCITVKIGVESADPDLLIATRRVADRGEAERYVRRSLDVAKAAVEAGLTCRVFVMTGLPGETEATVRRTAGFVRRLPEAVRVHVKPFIWYPGLDLAPGLGVRDDWLDMLGRAVEARGAGLWARLRSRLR